MFNDPIYIKLVSRNMIQPLAPSPPTHPLKKSQTHVDNAKIGPGPGGRILTRVMKQLNKTKACQRSQQEISRSRCPSGRSSEPNWNQQNPSMFGQSHPSTPIRSICSAVPFLCVNIGGAPQKMLAFGFLLVFRQTSENPQKKNTHPLV